METDLARVGNFTILRLLRRPDGLLAVTHDSVIARNTHEGVTRRAQVIGLRQVKEGGELNDQCLSEIASSACGSVAMTRLYVIVNARRT